MSPADSSPPPVPSPQDAQGVAGGFRLLDNVWHPDLPPDAGWLRLHLHAAPPAPVGWDWEWRARPDDPIPAAFPSLVAGIKPWDGIAAPGDFGLPVRLDALRALEVHWQPRLQAAGRFNLVVEGWLCEPGRIEADGIIHEWMIWLARGGGVQPIGRPLASGDDCTIWHGDGRHWQVTSVVLSRPPPGSRLDVGHWLRRLASLRLVDTSLVLADLEFGTEIWDGAGRLRCQLPRIRLEADG